MYQREHEYEVYISILSKKLKLKVRAYSAKEAKQKVLDLVIVHKIKPIILPDIDWGDPTTWVK